MCLQGSSGQRPIDRMLGQALLSLVSTLAAAHTRRNLVKLHACRCSIHSHCYKILNNAVLAAIYQRTGIQNDMRFDKCRPLRC